MNNDYHFITHWRVMGTAEGVFDLIHNPLDFPRWWHSVYSDARQIAPGDGNGVGRLIRFHTKGWLPYTLRWDSQAVEIDRSHRLMIRATGDFNGRGIWTIKQNDREVEIEFDWKLTADKPLLRYLSFLFKPIFSASHRWAMAQGEKSLAEELKRKPASPH